jgi:multiple antibiotic resistance protein
MILKMEHFPALKLFVTLLALVNPLGVLPAYLGLVANRSEAERAAIARTASSGVATVIIVSALAGTTILSVFGIEISAFRAAGGLILMIMGVKMLLGTPEAQSHAPGEGPSAGAPHDVSIAVVPLAMPLLAGPGTIVAALVSASHSSGVRDYVVLIVCSLVIGALTWACLGSATGGANRLGKRGVDVATRIFGLLLVAMGVEFVAVGLRTLWPGLMAH